MTEPGNALTLAGPTLDRLMPMHLILLPSGHIAHAAPTLQKLSAGRELVGKRFLEEFELKRPMERVKSFNELQAITGANMRLHLRSLPRLRLKGIILPVARSDSLLVNMSFGLSVVEAVRELGLSNGDFAPTDLAIEMLYIVEAKSAVMDESRRLNDRLQSARRAAEEQALSDTLTGLRNRRAMDAVLANLVDSERAFGLMHLDLDYFKAVNDTLGHKAGDHVLQVAAQILLDETRKRDTVARVGGDEFVLVFEDLVDSEKLSAIAARIVKRLEEPVVFEGRTCRISGSIGFTTSEFYDRPDLDRMLSDVDVALYASKHKGRACTTMVTRDLLESGAAKSPEGKRCAP